MPHWSEVVLLIDGHHVHIDYTLTWSGVFDWWLFEEFNDLVIIRGEHGKSTKLGHG
jgi:hypothetical protein